MSFFRPSEAACSAQDCIYASVNAGAGLSWVVGDAEQLPLTARSVDGYTIAFGIRNVTRIDAALAEAHRVRLLLPSHHRAPGVGRFGASRVTRHPLDIPRHAACKAGQPRRRAAEPHQFTQVLKPGGQFLCLEFSQLVLPGLRELYDAYSFNVIPQIGRHAPPTPPAQPWKPACSRTIVQARKL